MPASVCAGADGWLVSLTVLENRLIHTGHHDMVGQES